jgi:hypothetical protein
MMDEQSLDKVLTRSLPKPLPPADLRAAVMAAIAREAAPDWQRRREALENEYRAAIAKLNVRYLRRSRDGLLAGSGLIATLGLFVRPVAALLTPLFDSAAPMVAGALALAAGLLLGAYLMRTLFGNYASPIR